MVAPWQPGPDGSYAEGSRFGQDVTAKWATGLLKPGVVDMIPGMKATADDTFRGLFGDANLNPGKLIENMGSLLAQATAMIFGLNTAEWPEQLQDLARRVEAGDLTDITDFVGHARPKEGDPQ